MTGGGYRLLASGQTLRGSFSAVSTATIATKYSFCSVFRDLQDLHSFAPLRIQKIRKLLSNFLRFFIANPGNFAIFESNSLFFVPILMKICRNFANFSEFLYPVTRNSGESEILTN